MNKDNIKNITKKYDVDFNKSDQPLVSIITVTRNIERFLEKFFLSIHSQTYKNIEVIIVDNDSSDNTVETDKSLMKNGVIIENIEGIGFAGANNVGIEYSSGEYAFFLNADAFIDNKCVEELVKASSQNKNAIYAPRQMIYSGTEFISCGVAADLFGYPARSYSRDGKKQIRTIFFADGAAFCMTKEAYIKAGMMDAKHFLFMEDVDLSWKAHMLGMEIVPVQSAMVYHFSGGTIGEGGYPKDKVYVTNSERRFLAERNVIRNVLKNYQWWNILWVLPFYMIITIAESIAMLITGQPHVISQTYIRAYKWNVDNFSSTMKKRQEIQSKRTKGDLYVISKMQFFPSKFFALLELGIPIIKK